MSAPSLLNAADRRRSPVTLPGYLAGRPPRNKGLRCPPDPPTIEEIVAVMRAAGNPRSAGSARQFEGGGRAGRLRPITESWVRYTMAPALAA
jgi:hypothetical protein